MFRPRTMARVDILLLQRDLDPLLRALAGAGIFHLRPLARIPGSGNEEKGLDRERLDRLRELENRLLRLANRLSAPGGKGREPEALDALEVRIDEWEGRLASLERRRKDLTRLADRLEDLELLFRALSPARGSLAELQEMHFAFFEAGLAALRHLETPPSLPPGVALMSLARKGDEALLGVVGLQVARKDLDPVLAQIRFRPLILPPHTRGAISELPGRLQQVRRRVFGRLKDLEHKRSLLADEVGPDLGDALRGVRLARSLLELRTGFGYTERVAVVGGWVPAGRLKTLRRILRESCGERAVLHSQRARGSDTPVLLGNPRLIRPFERLLAFYGTPSYGELEPTPFLALGFLMLFGMMFGDLGHGLVFLAAGLALRRWSRFREEGLILAEMGVFAALFGLLFGSVFGREDLLRPIWFSPMHDIPAFMGAALVLGAGLILTGLALRVWNGLRGGDPGVLTDRFGLAGLVFYGGALGTGYLVFRGQVPGIGLAWLVLPLLAVWAHPWVARKVSPQGVQAAPGLLVAEGAVEVLETVLGFVANTFSFLRVAAFGLAHVGLFMAVFAVADVVRVLPLGWFWAALVHLAGNLVILVLEGLVVSVQTVRLEFYEIFSKFFQGGGVAYHPLSLDRLLERRP